MNSIIIIMLDSGFVQSLFWVKLNFPELGKL